MNWSIRRWYGRWLVSERRALVQQHARLFYALHLFMNGFRRCAAWFRLQWWARAAVFLWGTVGRATRACGDPMLGSLTPPLLMLWPVGWLLFVAR